MASTYININGEARDAASLELPATGRHFRAAWQFNGNVVEVDMAKARELQKDVIRAERKPLLEALDVEWFRAVETGGDVAAVAAKKQALRDVTSDPRIEAAATPEELKALTLKTLVEI